MSAPLDARVGLQSELTTFVQSYPTDPQGRWARIYLAWIALQRGELELSERWLTLAEPGRAGGVEPCLEEGPPIQEAVQVPARRVGQARAD